MKKFYIINLVCLGLVLLFSGPALGADSFTVLFTHDVHSHLTADVSNFNGVPEETGGFAKLKTAIDGEKLKYPQALLVDAGDFSMGTLFQTIYTTEAAELRSLGRLGFEYTTLGNHEFDYRTAGLTEMLYAAIESNEDLPRLLTANIDWQATLADPELEADAAELMGALEAIEAKPYEIIEKDGVEVVVFGLIGAEAVEYAPLSGLHFADARETADAVVAEIKAEAPNAVIICLSHSGTTEEPKDSEDEILAAEVPDIDVIISGHSHTTLAEPLRVGNTLIVSAGEYTQNLGSLTFALDQENTVLDYRLIPLDKSVPEDEETLSAMAEFKADIQNQYLSPYGYTFDQIIARTDFDFTPIADFAQEPGEDTLGNLIADAYIYGVSQAEGENSQPADVAVVPSGVVRGSLSRGDITVSQIFNVSSLGVGPDGETGYPLVSVYLTGKELWSVCEVDASVSALMPVAQLYMSGLWFTYNPHRFFLNRVTDLRLMAANAEETPLRDDKLYRVVADLYSAQMLGTVKDLSWGLLALTPKDENGQEITDFEEHIIYDAAGNEVKAWVSLAQYLGSFSRDESGLAVVPSLYEAPQGRKVAVNDTSLTAKLSHPNKVTLIFAAVIILILVIIFLVIFIPLRRRRGRKKQQ